MEQTFHIAAFSAAYCLVLSCCLILDVIFKLFRNIRVRLLVHLASLALFAYTEMCSRHTELCSIQPVLQANDMLLVWYEMFRSIRIFSYSELTLLPRYVRQPQSIIRRESFVICSYNKGMSIQTIFHFKR